ncbi:hypothetical protein NQ318_010932 [Aromia moschata]|uniref:Protein crumbs n=1 Tax=Aromia moschata TaxID=1265417 RepID=A0AAV8XE46_9CUCU|nr:hypothetical protein NQ318_010932 [Aromia moschata]
MLHGTCLNAQNTYTCDCLPRYTGKNCEIDLGNPCDRVPPVCKNSATCRSDVAGDFSCACAPGFTGRLCEQELKIHPRCNVNPCLNGGTCDYNPETDRVQCHCRPGYAGPNCEINVDECTPNPCLNGGLCTDGFNNFTCDCSHTGYKGRTCEINIDECSAAPLPQPWHMLRHLWVVHVPVRPRIQGGRIASLCKHENVDECSSQPCFNNGVCISRSGGYECSCLAGYLGDHCEVEQGQQRQCDPSACPAYADCVDGGPSLRCACKPEYPGDFPNCNVESACASNPCTNGGTCTPHKGYYNCSCPPGFEGPACERRTGCFKGSSSLTCMCAYGWSGLGCGSSEHSLCSTNPCSHAVACLDYLGGYFCTCQPGWTGLNCDVQLGPCTSDPCLNAGICQEDDGYFTCLCPTGFEGKRCQVNIDECSSSPCLNGATCVDKINGFLCACTDQWMGAFCEKPYDVCELRPCKNNASCVAGPNKRDFACQCVLPPGQICVDLVNDFECKCPPGFTGKDCATEVDPAPREPCHNGTCIVNNVTNKLSCVCHPGYTAIIDDMIADATTDPVLSEREESDSEEEDDHSPTPTVSAGLQNMGKLRKLISTLKNAEDMLIYFNRIDNFLSTHATKNLKQSTLDRFLSGTFCNQDLDECASTANKICNNGICVNTVGGFQCYCMPGYTGERCNLDFDECLSMPCRNNATCVNMNIDECDPNPCMAGATCVDGVNEFTCRCQPGLTGKLCDINIDDCESSPCRNGARCIDGLNSYTCDCSDTGYEGVHCENNIDDCVGEPCVNGAKCVDKVNDYACNCYRGILGNKSCVSGKTCDIDINECESNPCQFNGTCLERSNQTLYDAALVAQLDIELPPAFERPFNYSSAFGYECLCVPGVTGQNCEINVNECESNPCPQRRLLRQSGRLPLRVRGGLRGESCDKDIDECVKYRPCVYGSCMDRVANYYCHCDAGYGGKNCSVPLIGCMSNPCMNDGQCRPYLVDEVQHKFNCSCPNGFHGNTEEGYDIQFRFKTTLGDGLLAIGKGLTYYILELSRGRLNLHSSLLNKWEGVFIGSNLNDSNWQKVFVAINATHLVLSANEEQTIYPISYNENNVSSTSFPVTYIGGNPGNLRKLTHGQPSLVGCTEDVLINGQWVLPQVRTAPWLAFQNVTVGCLREPHCTCSASTPGHTCQYNYTAATFGYENITSSLVTVDVADTARRAVRSIVDISMFIRTRQPKGQIFYLGSGFLQNHQASSNNDTCIAAQLESGELCVQIQFNGVVGGYTVRRGEVGQWVIRNVTLVQVKLNGSEYFRKTIAAAGTLDAQVLYLGGLPQSRSVRQTNENMAPLKMEGGASPTAPASLTTQRQLHDDRGVLPAGRGRSGGTPPFGDVTFDNSVLPGVHSDDSCRINPCQHNGVCENTWNDYRCLCPRGFKGKDCNELEFCELEGCPAGSFCKNLEDGYECIANSTNIDFYSIEVAYRTRSWGTALFGRLADNYFVVFIYHNEVVVEWSFGGLMTTKRFRKDRFEGQWISLLFLSKNRSFRGGFRENVVDDSPNFEVNDFDSLTFNEILKHGEVYVAGSDNKTFDYVTVIENTDYNMTGYIPSSDTTTAGGCLGEIRIGGLLLPYFLTKEIYPNQTYSEEFFELDATSRVRLGCVLCYDADCFNQGSCANDTETYKCNCRPGYAADDCSVDINECENNRCQNNATCVDGVAKYECDCLPGYEGLYCETDIDECLSNPCRHGGTCNDLVGTFKCDCPEDFVGKQCEAPLLITCENRPCREGATCQKGPNEQTGNNFTCFCTEGMEGPLCDTPFCQRQHCVQGSCDTTGEVPYCLCPSGFEGKFCEVNVDDCVSPTGGSPCQNGGVCIDGVSRYDCNCTGTGYTGLLCEMDTDECKEYAMPCGRAGTCQNMPGSYRCICDTIKGKCGHQCDLDDPCETTNPCVHGTCHSQCTDTPDYVCMCEDNYTGKNCTEIKVAASLDDGGLNVLYIVVPVILIILIGMAIGMAVLVNVARSKRATAWHV